MCPLLPALALSAMLSLVMTGLQQTANAATLLPQEKAGQIVALRNINVKDGDVSGEVVNNSKNTVRDVQLQILYSWRWKDEFHPGKDDPGRAAYHVLDKELPPGQSARFNYSPSPPLPARKDGMFEITVTVAGFSEIIR
jgi:hypothetical protein